MLAELEGGLAAVPVGDIIAASAFKTADGEPKVNRQLSYVRHDVGFMSNGTPCAAWLYRPDGVANPPIVVLAHGFAAFRELRPVQLARQDDVTRTPKPKESWPAFLTAKCCPTTALISSLTSTRTSSSGCDAREVE